MIQLEKYQSGTSEKHHTGYTYFRPAFINDQWKWEDQALNVLLEKASIKLGELNSYAQLVPDIRLFIRAHVTKEAVVSSQIEGTQTQMDEAFLEETDIAPERKNDWKEVSNYITAMNWAITALDTTPISSRLIKQTHKILLDSVRGEHKAPGEYRASQNWIGGTTLLDAAFIPPHQDFVPDLMGDLEKFLHNEAINVPDLVRIGIIHYQFETIHPFLDGNGRIGRLLITLFLVDKKILQKPLLYLSSYFEKNKTLYYDNLTFVRSKNNMTQWLKYFLAGVVETAENATKTLSAVLVLKNRLENIINTSKRKSNNSYALLQHLFTNPIVQVKDVQKALNITYNPANELITRFAETGILAEITNQSRNRLFVFDEYLRLFR